MSSEFDDLLKEEQEEQMMGIYQSMLDAISDKKGIEAISESIMAFKGSMEEILKKIPKNDSSAIIMQLSQLNNSLKNNSGDDKMIESFKAVLTEISKSNQSFKEYLHKINFSELMSEMNSKLAMIQEHLKNQENAEWNLTVTKRDKFQNFESATMKRIK